MVILEEFEYSKWVRGDTRARMLKNGLILTSDSSFKSSLLDLGMTEHGNIRSKLARNVYFRKIKYN